ncbi:hypothetical protein [Streptomyces sp. NPDC096339]|uniref:hypothetical protein n=1 Tax=Streptomyces sp. NPDC096339 TaxID=3366086 RepID=UPI00380C3DDD
MSSRSSSILAPVRRRTSMLAQVQKALFSSHSASNRGPGSSTGARNSAVGRQWLLLRPVRR